jgi:3-methyladenine DNA glycosylase AlkD
VTLAEEIDERLQAAARPHRAGSVDGHSISAMPVLGATVPDIRAIVRDVDRQTKGESAAFVVDLAAQLVGAGTLEARQIGYELLGRRKDALSTLGTRAIEALGRGNDNWKSVDVFSCEVTGRCWRDGKLTDAAVRRWARSEDRWWRRTALVTTVPLNMKSRGGVGDATRTLDICALCAGDRDDMVVKACSWALRELGERDPKAVRAFLRHQTLAPRVVREVRRKLDTGRKAKRRT